MKRFLLGLALGMISVLFFEDKLFPIVDKPIKAEEAIALPYEEIPVIPEYYDSSFEETAHRMSI